MLKMQDHYEDLLGSYLDEHEGALDFHGLHGFLTALTIMPTAMTPAERNEHLFDAEGIELPNSVESEFATLISNMQTQIDRGFHDEENGFTLSCEAEIEDAQDDVIANWATGFMVAHFINEDAWFAAHEQEVFELLLPIMLASGLFDDEEEFITIRKDEELVENMVAQIPEVLMELYLLFNAPEEKKGPRG